MRKPPFNNKTITEHDSEITVVDKIGIKNAGVDQLGDEHQNYEIAGLEYEKNGEISGVNLKNTTVVVVDMPLNEILEGNTKPFE